MSAIKANDHRTLSQQVRKGDKMAASARQREQRHGIANFRRSSSDFSGEQTSNELVISFGKRKIEFAKFLGIGCEPYAQQGVHDADRFESLSKGTLRCHHRDFLSAAIARSALSNALSSAPRLAQQQRLWVGTVKAEVTGNSRFHSAKLLVSLIPIAYGYRPERKPVFPFEQGIGHFSREGWQTPCGSRPNF